MRKIAFIVFSFLLSINSIYAQWTELGTNNPLNANAIYFLGSDAAGNIYACGTDNLSERSAVVKWNGSIWENLSTDIKGWPLNSSVHAMHTDALGNIYIGAVNYQFGYYAAKWNGTTWTVLGTGSSALNANYVISAITNDGLDNIYISGNFYNAQGKRYVAKWDGTAWSEVGTGNNALNAIGQLLSLAVDATGNIYVAGYINSQDDIYDTIAVSKWNGTNWMTLVGDGSNSVFSNSRTPMILNSAGELYIAMNYNQAPPGTNFHQVAKWNGTRWIELDSGAINLSPEDGVIAMTFDSHDKLYAVSNMSLNNNYYITTREENSWKYVGADTNLFISPSGFLTSTC